MNSLKKLSLLFVMLIVEQSTHSAAYPDYAGRYQTGGYDNRADGSDSSYYDYLTADQPMITPENGFATETIYMQKPSEKQIREQSQPDSFRKKTEEQYSYTPPQIQQKTGSQAAANSADRQPRSPIGTASGRSNSTSQQSSQTTPQPAVRFADSTKQQHSTPNSSSSRKLEQSQAASQSSGRFMSAAQEKKYRAQQQENAYEEGSQSEDDYAQEYDDYPAYNTRPQNQNTSRSQSQSVQPLQPTPKQSRSIAIGTNNNSSSRNLAADTTKLIDKISVKAQIPRAKELVEQSYFSPEMQYAVLACVNRPFKVNVVTGKISNIPTIDEIIASQPIDSKIKRNALHAALEAVQVARFYAKLNIAYDNPAYVFFAPTLSSNRFLMPSLDEDLETLFNVRENDIQNAINSLNEAEGYSFIWSWIPTDLVNMFSIMPRGLTSQETHISKLEFNADVNNLDKNTYPGNFVTITGSTIKDLIKNFDYKQKVNVQDAANLLFKQCFIAQQTFPTEDWPLFCTPLGSAVTASNYIFDRFEVTRTKIMKQDNSQFLQVNTQSITPTHAKNIDELCSAISTSADTPPHNRLQAHLLFLRIRKAIQTAMYIANKNSNFYAGYILPPAITKYLDGIVGQLIAYDTKLSILCKDQRLGATKDDLLRDKMWTNITGIATGLGVLSAVGGIIDLGYGAGTSAKLAESTAENATYYGGKAIVNTAYYGTTIPLQAAAGVVTGTIAGAQGVVSGAVKGAQDFIADYRKKPETPAPAAQNAPAEKSAEITPASSNPAQEIVTTAQPAA